MAKTIATRLAEHFGWDVADVREHDYHHGKWSQKVYAFDDEYWSAGPKAPRYLDEGGLDLDWQPVESSYRDGGRLWRAKI